MIENCHQGGDGPGGKNGPDDHNCMLLFSRQDLALSRSSAGMHTLDGVVALICVWPIAYQDTSRYSTLLPAGIANSVETLMVPGAYS
jgi:hypothetical protein